MKKQPRSERKQEKHEIEPSATYIERAEQEAKKRKRPSIRPFDNDGDRKRCTVARVCVRASVPIIFDSATWKSRFRWNARNSGVPRNRWDRVGAKGIGSFRSGRISVNYGLATPHACFTVAVDGSELQPGSAFSTAVSSTSAPIAVRSVPSPPFVHNS